jgi:acid phosphatase class B
MANKRTELYGKKYIKAVNNIHIYQVKDMYFLTTINPREIIARTSSLKKAFKLAKEHGEELNTVKRKYTVTQKIQIRSTAVFIARSHKEALEQAKEFDFNGELLHRTTKMKYESNLIRKL